MRMLVLGGTVFLSRAVATDALARGHEVTCAARGSSGEPPEGAEFVRVDRDDADGYAALAGRSYDAVVDVARQPSHVHGALRALADRAGHWTFVSTISVYADDATPGQRPDTGTLHPPLAPGQDEADPQYYGWSKVSCEEAVADAFGERAFVLRAGLIVGPGDPSNRFGYWVERVARGGELLAPGGPAELVQYVDVADLADWIVRGAEQSLTGTFDAIGPPLDRWELLSRIAVGVHTRIEPVWVDQDFLLARDVSPWAGPRSLPMWLPLPAYAGLMTHDAVPAVDAGLRIRDLADTARDVRAWQLSDDAGPRSPAGLSVEEEVELLSAWRASGRAIE